MIYFFFKYLNSILSEQIYTCRQVIVPDEEQRYAATSSQVTTIIHEAEKLIMLGNKERILLVPRCKMALCVVVR